MAKYGYRKLKDILYRPSSLEINTIYAGSYDFDSDYDYCADDFVVVIDYSAMNNVGGYSRGYMVIKNNGSNYAYIYDDFDKYYFYNRYKTYSNNVLF